MIHRARAIGEAGMDVFAGEIGEVFQQFLDADRGGERIEHVADAHPGAGNNRAAAADIGVDDDACGHGGSMWGKGGGRQGGWIGCCFDSTLRGDSPKFCWLGLSMILKECLTLSSIGRRLFN